MAHKSILERLPAELRIQIYRLAVADEQPIEVANRQYINKQPALACINRQLRSEVLPIYCNVNTFIFGAGPFDNNPVNTMFMWLKVLGQSADHLRSVGVFPEMTIGRQAESYFVADVDAHRRVEIISGGLEEGARACTCSRRGEVKKLSESEMVKESETMVADLIRACWKDMERSVYRHHWTSWRVLCGNCGTR